MDVTEGVQEGVEFGRIIGVVEAVLVKAKPGVGVAVEDGTGPGVAEAVPVGETELVRVKEEVGVLDLVAVVTGVGVGSPYARSGWTPGFYRCG